LKYLDQNQDGRYQVTEPRISGVTIRLYDRNNNLLAQSVTDHNGYYRFGALAAGTYIVQEVTPIGYMSTSPSRVTVNLGANQIYTLHFGNVPV
jgi:protocatechuate 3,4-dioxygenase beta subunit